MKLVYFCLVGILGVAVIIDCQTFKIPNALIVGALVGGFVVKGTNAILTGDLLIMADMFIAILLTMIILIPLYVFKALGAGDIKLFIVISAYTSMKESLYICLLSLFIGAIIGLIKILSTRMNNISFHRIHYSIPIFLATLISIVQ